MTLRAAPPSSSTTAPTAGSVALPLAQLVAGRRSRRRAGTSARRAMHAVLPRSVDASVRRERRRGRRCLPSSASCSTSKRALERPGPLLDARRSSAPPLAGAVVDDHRLDAPPSSVATAIAIRVGGPRRIGLVDRLADDLVERGLRPLGRAPPPASTSSSIWMLVREPDLLGQRLHRRPEALVAQHDRLEVEREVAELADRLALPLERHAEHARAPRRSPPLDRVEHARRASARSRTSTAPARRGGRARAAAARPARR